MSASKRLTILACLALSACAGIDVPCGRDDGIALPVAMRGAALLVPVRVNGITQVYMVDTGGAVSVMERRSAYALGLMHKLGQNTVRDVAGERVVDVVTADKLNIGTLVFDNQHLVVSDGLPVDGVIGLDILSRYDLDIDEPHNRMTLHKAGLCQGDKPLADGPVLEMAAIRGIKSGSGAGQHTAPFLLVAAKLDGKYGLAMLDSGALSGSVVSARFANAAGTTSDHLADDIRVPIRGLGPTTQMAVHQFTELNVGGEIFSHPQLQVSTDLGARFPLVLGADYFRTHRIWLNFSADRVFSMPVAPRIAPGS